MATTSTISTLPSNKRDQQKKQTALAILNSAKQLFAQQGFDNTTTRAIAANAGVGTGTVFAHYPDKASLLGAALRGEIDRVIDTTRNALGQQTGLVDKLVFLSAGLLNYYIDNHNLSRELIKIASFQDGPEARAYNGQMAGFIELVSEVITAAIEQGVLSEKIEVTAVALNYMAIHFFMVLNCLRQEDPQREEMLGQMRMQIEALFAGYSIVEL